MNLQEFHEGWKIVGSHTSISRMSLVSCNLLRSIKFRTPPPPFFGRTLLVSRLYGLAITDRLSRTSAPLALRELAPDEVTLDRYVKVWGPGTLVFIRKNGETKSGAMKHKKSKA